MKDVKRLLIVCLLLGCGSALAQNDAPDFRVAYDLYKNNSTLKWDVEQYEKFEAPQPFIGVDISIITPYTYFVWDINAIVRSTYPLFGQKDDPNVADDDIHDVEFYRNIRMRGSFPVMSLGIGKLGMAYNLLDWYKVDADNKSTDEYRAGGVGVGVGISHMLIGPAWASHVAYCWNWGFNPDAKEINDSNLADKYKTLEADIWYFLNGGFGLMAKIHWEEHDFKQLTLKNVYPTLGPGKVKIMTYRLGVSFAITRGDDYY